MKRQFNNACWISMERSQPEPDSNQEVWFWCHKAKEMIRGCRDDDGNYLLQGIWVTNPLQEISHWQCCVKPKPPDIKKAKVIVK